MRRLQSIENDQVQLEVIECDCGFHYGLDASYLEAEGDFKVICPACKTIINTEDICPEDGEGKLDECNDVCCQHDPDCDGNCDHLSGHINACMVDNFS